MSTGPQSKLLKWWQTVSNLQATNAPAAQNAEDAAVDEQNELEGLYFAFNNLLAKSKLLEKENNKLKEEMNSLRLRNERDKKEFMKYATSAFAADVVCVADDIRRAIETVPREQLDAIPALNSLVEGFEVTERSLLTALRRHQVTRFYPLGEPFDPHLHEAKSAMSAPDLAADTVVQVIHAGFMIGERLLRPAGVVVAQASATTQPMAPHIADNQAFPASSGTQYLPDSAKQTGATGSGRYTQQADVSERSSSVLHKPVITGAQALPVAPYPVGATPNDKHHGTPEDWRINEGRLTLHESLGALRDWAEKPPENIYGDERDWPSLSGQEAADEVTEVSLASNPAQAIEGADEITKAVNEAFDSKNYAEAVRLQEKIAAAVRFIETAVEGKPGDGTLDALLSLTWYQLCAGQYDAVIAIAEEAAAIRKDYISMDTNRAHALMLTGSTDEAKIIYNQHRGKETRNKKTWESEVLGDFSELELANIKHPLMDEIRSAWAAES